MNSKHVFLIVRTLAAWVITLLIVFPLIWLFVSRAGSLRKETPELEQEGEWTVYEKDWAA